MSTLPWEYLRKSRKRHLVHIWAMVGKQEVTLMGVRCQWDETQGKRKSAQKVTNQQSIPVSFCFILGKWWCRHWFYLLDGRFSHLHFIIKGKFNLLNTRNAWWLSWISYHIRFIGFYIPICYPAETIKPWSLRADILVGISLEEESLRGWVDPSQWGLES